MELKLGITKEKARELKQARLAQGAIEVSTSALLVAYSHIIAEKNTDLDDQDFEGAATWKDNEKNILHGLADMGLAQPNAEIESTWPIIRVT